MFRISARASTLTGVESFAEIVYTYLLYMYPSSSSAVGFLNFKVSDPQFHRGKLHRYRFCCRDILLPGNFTAWNICCRIFSCRKLLSCSKLCRLKIFCYKNYPTGNFSVVYLTAGNLSTKLYQFRL